MATGGKRLQSRFASGASPNNRDNDDEESGSLSISYFESRFNELRSHLASKEDIIKLQEIIEKQKEKIELLEGKINFLESQVDFLHNQVEENQQYSRRQCLRIDGIPFYPDDVVKTEEDIRKAVKRFITELGLLFPARRLTEPTESVRCAYSKAKEAGR